MGQRLELHALLTSLVSPGKAYFQPPPSLQMVYPCIVYQRDRARTTFADDMPYGVRKRYQVTVIDRDPDSLIPAKVAALPTATHERTFAADDLNHDVYTLFF